MSIEDLLQSGDFRAALSALDEQTRGQDADPGQLLMAFSLRVRLHEFDAAFDTIRRIVALQPGVAGPMEGLRLCAEAERARAARQTDPAVAGRRAAIRPPPPFCMKYVEAAVKHASGDHAAAAAAIAEARRLAPPVKGTLVWTNRKSARFVDLVDSDDLTGPILPCYEGGKLLDLPYYELQTVKLMPPKTSFDVMWAPAEVITHQNDYLMVRIPSFYSGSGLHGIPPVRTGQMTTWDRAHGYAEGAGQRDLSVKTEDGGALMVGICQVQSLNFDPPDDAPAPKGLWQRLFGKG